MRSLVALLTLVSSGASISLVTLMSLVSFGAVAPLARAQEAAPKGAEAAGPSDLVLELRAEAEALRTNRPDDWAKHLAAVERIESDAAKRREFWRSRRPPPSPDYRPERLPVAFLFALYDAFLGETTGPRVHGVLATALAAADDERGLAYVMELHDADVSGHRDARYDRSHFARRIADAVAKERIPKLLAAQVARRPPVDRGALALRLLHRTKERLPDEVRTAARDWLATYPRGPHNGLGDEVWKLRMRLGDASDRDALIPHLLGKDDLLYCLWTILEKPLPHPRLASALREREARMNDHERSYLTASMKKALLLTAPDEEVRGYVEHLDALHEKMPARKLTDPASKEFHELVGPLRAVDHPVVEKVTRRFMKSDKLDWGFRCAWLETLILSERREAADLQAWWNEHAPQQYREYLEKMLSER